jgi:hypothetical protein
MTSYHYSKIIKYQNTFTVPLWIFDDVYYFYKDINIIKKEEHTVTLDINDYNEFIQLRKQIYWLCHWYPLLVQNNIPVISSTIKCINNDTKQMENILNDNLTDEPDYIRFCNASPKDVINPIFDCYTHVGDIVNIFKQSPRTFYMFENNHQTHLILRPIVNITYEVRCFWHQKQLRAVSGPEYYINLKDQKEIELTINDFFKTYGPFISYNSATIDLGIHDGKAFIIELNSFGLDMLAGAHLFDWQQDFNILYNSPQPIYKFKGEFEW